LFAEILKFRYDEFMSKVIAINERGTLTLPREMRQRFGLGEAGQVLAEETAEGILLRPGVTMPLEIYSARRIAEFERSDAELAPFVAGLRKKPSRRKRA
jgi:bifunctional DNA-binding transcriptional regulator/antitoxin component of YhaV-PrlF toxin-antitoxin module